MRLFSIIAIFIYTLIFSIIGAVLIALSLRAESLDLIINTARSLAHLNNVRIGIALVGFLLIFINISIAQLSFGKLQKQRTIAFDNPYGQVTISLSAIEDYIKKLTSDMSEIKEIKTSIRAQKSGVEVVAKTALYANANIPDVTEKIQSAIRARLQEMLGLEESVDIKVHVAKIVHEEQKDKGQGGTTSFKGQIEYGG